MTGFSAFRSWKSSTAPTIHKASPNSSSDTRPSDEADPGLGFGFFIFSLDFEWVWTWWKEGLMRFGEGRGVCEDWGWASSSGSWKEILMCSSALAFWGEGDCVSNFLKQFLCFSFGTVPPFWGTGVSDFHALLVWFFGWCFFSSSCLGLGKRVFQFLWGGVFCF